MNYLLLAAAVAFNVSAYMVFKKISPWPPGIPWATLFAAGLALGGINTYCFTVALKGIDLATAYPVFAGSSIMLVVLLSAVLFGENVSIANVVGSAVVIAGIVILTR